MHVIIVNQYNLDKYDKSGLVDKIIIDPKQLHDVAKLQTGCYSIMKFRIAIKTSRKSCFILSDSYDLYNYRTIEKFNFKITRPYIHGLCVNKRIDTINYLKNTNNIPTYLDYNTIMDAALIGDINILEWWGNMIKPPGYTDSMLDLASRHCNINVLDAWKNSNYPLKYSEMTLDYAANYVVAEWWFNSGLPLKYTEKVFINACRSGLIHYLDFWENSGVPFIYPEKLLKYIVENNVREWWNRHRKKLLRHQN
uniref:Uncharacterized protein n=1 Tax=viral metagenome TaxID=1070528 RepID=A0A6C0EA06_9ZZZZ